MICTLKITVPGSVTLGLISSAFTLGLISSVFCVRLTGTCSAAGSAICCKILEISLAAPSRIPDSSIAASLSVALMANPELPDERTLENRAILFPG